VQVTKDKNVLGELGAGGLVGSALLLSGVMADVDAVAVETLRAMRWEVETLLKFLDANPETLTLLVQDENGRDAATISLVFDAFDGLPCDEIYGAELLALRAQGRRLVEVTRLAIDPEFQRSKALLVCLFNFIYVFARRVKGRDDFVIEVNPRHVNYYCKLLNFETAGPERACPRVQGAPAVLLRLDLSAVEREVERVGGTGETSKERTLYPHFFAAEEEGSVADFLARRHAPMSGADAEYFLGSRRDATHSLSN